MVKTFKNHSKDRELDEFEEDLTQGKSIQEKAPDTSDAEQKRYKSGKDFYRHCSFKSKGSDKKSRW